MTYVVTSDVEPGIHLVTLSKPERLNAIDFNGVRKLRGVGFIRSAHRARSNVS